MKIILGIFIFLTIFIGLIFGLLFTQSGNNLLKPLIESKLNELSPLSAKVDKFSLRFNTFLLSLEFEKGSKISLEGDYSMVGSNIDAIFEVDIKDLSLLNRVTNQNLRGELFLKGSAKGDKAHLEVKAISNVADSKSALEILLVDYKPSKIDAEVVHAKIEKILYMLNRAEFAKGNLDVDVKIDDIKDGAIFGNLLANLTEGVVNRSVFLDEFNISLPATNFNSKAKVSLNGEDILHSVDFRSNLANINSEGSSNINSKSIDAKYVVDIKELALFKPITKQQLNGKLYTEGTIKGGGKSIEIDGKSDIAKSKTRYLVTIEEGVINIATSIKEAKLDELLYMVNQPKYAKANLDIDAKLLDITSKSIDGSISLSAIDGLLSSDVISKENDILIPKNLLGFEAKSLINIDKSVVNASSSVDSKIADIRAKKTLFDINSGDLSSDFEVEIDNLNNLYFLAKRELKGEIKVVGDIKKDRDLLLNARSDVFGGLFEAELINDDLTQKFRGIKLAKLLDMLTYPEFFDSDFNSELKYNILTKKGKLDATLDKGNFRKSEMTSIVLATTGFDLTKEIYSNSTLDSVIDDNIISTNFNLQSEYTKISTEGAIFDINRSLVDAKIYLDIRGDSVALDIKGAAKKPNIKIDAKDLVKKELGKAIDRNMNEIDKIVPKEAQEPIKSILKGIFGN